MVAARGLLLISACSPNEAPAPRVATSAKLSSPRKAVILRLMVSILWMACWSSVLENFSIMFFLVISPL